MARQEESALGALTAVGVRKAHKLNTKGWQLFGIVQYRVIELLVEIVKFSIDKYLVLAFGGMADPRSIHRACRLTRDRSCVDKLRILRSISEGCSR